MPKLYNKVYNKFMFNFLCKTFIPNYDDVNNSAVREKYGIVFSIFSIICNIFLVVFKLIISFVTNSISIRADALNNLSDVGSNLAALFGFRLSNKHADADHPYGHGRMEYVSGMIVSFLILLMGFSSIKESILKIIDGEKVVYSSIAIVILAFSIATKLLMCYVNNCAGKAINSETLLAAGKDSFSDAIMTSATLVCLIIYRFTNLNIDAYCGFVVSIFVLKAGLGIFHDVLDTILGKAPDKELIHEIEKTICAHDEILGIHDLMLHDYGPSQKFMSLHAEVDSRVPIIETHDMIDNIEMEVLEKFNILTTIHMDPVDIADEKTNTLKKEVIEKINKINEKYKIHDFRIVSGPSHTNIVFDVLLPADDKNDIETLRKQISNSIKELDQSYNCVINFDRDYA